MLKLVEAKKNFKMTFSSSRSLANACKNLKLGMFASCKLA